MICCILMLSSLVSSVWGTCVVKVAQSSYQAEENGDVTLEWTFTTTAHSSSDSLFIYCSQLTVHKESVLFRLHEGVEVPESQDEQFSGRVQWDTDVLREGRLRLHVSRLRTEDSGLYLCDVSTGNDGSYDSCDLNVTAAGDEPKPLRPTVSPQPESQGWISVYSGLITTTAVDEPKPEVSPVISGTFVVKVTQRYSQAEENGDVTLEWTFTTTAHSSSDSLSIRCRQLTVHKRSVLFLLLNGVELPESQDEQFSGRVQWDTDVLRDGRLRLHVSRLRTEDSGSYLCEVWTGNDGDTDICHLNVTAAGDEHKHQSHRWTRLHIGLIAAAAALLCVCVVLLAFSLVLNNQLKINKSPHIPVKQQTGSLLDVPLFLSSSNQSMGHPLNF